MDLHQPRVAIAAVLAAMVLVVLDSAIANLALPSIATSLATTPARSVLVVTAYQLALLIALLPCAALGESVGYRRVFTGGVALFAAGSALCAVAPSLNWLVAARFVQGLGGAAILSLGLALLRLVLPPSQFGRAISWNALTVGLTSAAGPTIGAIVLAHASWPWLFAINVPLAVTVGIATRVLPESNGTQHRLDRVSLALNGAAFALLVVGAELLPSQPLIASALLLAAALGVAALVRRESPKKIPLIPVDLLRSESFRLSVVASIFCFTGQTAGMVALPFYLQHEFGLRPLSIGLYLTPWPLTVALAAPLSGKLADRVPTAWLCAAGGILLAMGLLAGAIWPLNGNPLPLVATTVVCGLGFGLFQVPNNRNLLLSAPRERSGSAGGLQATARLTGQTLGAVIMTLLFTAASIDLAPRLGLGIGAALAVLAAAASVLRTPRKAPRIDGFVVG